MSEAAICSVRRKRAFANIDKEALRNPNITPETVGVLCCILALPPGWQFHRAWARKRFKMGREKLDRVFKELAEFGYVQHTQERYPDGRMGPGKYRFTDVARAFADEPESENENEIVAYVPQPENPTSGEPAAGQTAPTEYFLEKEGNIELTDCRPVDNAARGTTRTAAKASGRPAPARQARGALVAQHPKKAVASSEADAGAAAMRERIRATLKPCARTLQLPLGPEPGTGRAAELAGRRAGG